MMTSSNAKQGTIEQDMLLIFNGPLRQDWKTRCSLGGLGYPSCQLQHLSLSLLTLI